MDEMTIGQVSKQADIPIGTIRYYEKRGLLNEPNRSKTGYRLYDESVINRITLIKRAQSLGFSLNEIKKLLQIYNQEADFEVTEIYSYTK